MVLQPSYPNHAESPPAGNKDYPVTVKTAIQRLKKEQPSPVRNHRPRFNIKILHAFNRSFINSALLGRFALLSLNSSNNIVGNKPIAVGQGYSTIAWIPEDAGSWALPLRHERITSWESPIDRILAAISTPAQPPKLRGKSPGCPTGKSRQRRIRYPIVKKGTIRRKKQASKSA